MEAQNFPDDFDGITAGAPAFAWAGLMVWEGYFATITGPPGSPTFLSPDLWNIVLKDLNDQCDGLDGHVDGVIEDPGSLPVQARRPHLWGRARLQIV